MFAEGVYLLFYNNASYRKNINRRLKVMDDKTDRESVLVQLRRERGLTSGGDYRLPLVNLNQLLLQSGLDDRPRPAGSVHRDWRGRGCFRPCMTFEGKRLYALIAALFCGIVLPLSFCGFLRRRRQKKFGSQFPDAHRHHRARPARRPSGADRHHDGGAGNAGPDRHRVRHCLRRDHLRRRSRNRDAQSVFPRRHRRPAAVCHRGCDSALDRRQPRRNSGKSFGGDPPAVQDAPQDSRAGGGRPCIGPDPLVAADRHVLGHPVSGAEFLRGRLGPGYDQDRACGSPACWMGVGNFIMYRMVNFRI